jgi:hypothetical protein
MYGADLRRECLARQLQREGGQMPKAQDVRKAVWDELKIEKRPEPSDGTEVLGTTYLYTNTTIKGFLLGVARLLEDGTPSYTFYWTKLDPDTCVGANVNDLCGYIAAETT